MSIGPFQILIVAMLILILFGRGRISEMMGDFGKGVKSFRRGLTEADEVPAPPRRIQASTPESEARPHPASDRSGG